MRYGTWEVLPAHHYTDLKMYISEDENRRYNRHILKGLEIKERPREKAFKLALI